MAFMAILISFLVVSPCLLAVSGTPATLNLQPGEYDFTITYEVQGEQPAKPKTAARCITFEELDRPEEVFSESSAVPHEVNDPCVVKNLKTSGEKISYDAECANRLVHVEGKIRRTEFVVVRDVRPKRNSGVPLRFTLRGRRTGDCRKGGQSRESKPPHPGRVEEDPLQRRQE